MSYPPDPQAPYGGGPYGQQQPGYGYPQQQPAPQPGYGYPPQYPGAAPVPGMPHGPAAGMPGQVVTARVLLFVAGSIWLLVSLLMLIGGFAAQNMLESVPGMDGGAALGVALLLFLLFAGMGALHVMPAAVFGRSGTGARVTGIIGASLNGLCGVFYVVASLAMISQDEDGGAGLLLVSLLWAATGITTVVLLSLGQAGRWFTRP
ncbi:hypothetical protein [Streptomyces sp. TR06-5]|uniref:hypothetical protein n=1 Tax=unclassified Streptomyces TaxID=2593676 RepID=UPI0039A219C0